MNIHEYQAKELLAKFGVGIPAGIPALTVEEAVAAAGKLPGPLYVVKAQIHAGGRGKGKFKELPAEAKGGVRLAKSAAEVEANAREMLGNTLVTIQTGEAGKQVNRLYVTDGVDIGKEYYLSMVVDRASGRVALIVSTEGGMDIEEVAHSTPEKITTITIDPAQGFQPHHGRAVAFALKLTGDLNKQAQIIAKQLYDAFVALDCAMLEINPLVETTPGERDVTGGMTVPRQFIPKNLIHEAILNAPISWYGTTSATSPLEDQFTKYTYPAEGCPELHMIWTDSPCWITCWNDTNTYIKALRSPKIEFILAQHPWMENDCLFADIILPVNTKFEEKDIATDSMGGQFHLILQEQKCIEPIGESHSDYEIACMVAERFGLLEAYTGGKSVDELVKIGFDNSGVQNMITFEEFMEKGYFVLPTDPEWQKYPAGLIKFYEHPEENPLKTPSGKVEFYSQNLAKYFPDDQERPPVPHWIEKGISHDENLSSERAKQYPLLIVSNHGRWRVHANHDDITWIREIGTSKVQGPDGYKYEPLWINPADAAARGIESGDVVKVHNERGAVLGGAYITERIMPGVVYMDHGARYDPLVPGELDRGGAINTLTPHNLTSKNATGMVASGFLVEVEGVNLGELRRKYPDAFNRPYDPAAGLRLERVLTKK